MIIHRFPCPIPAGGNPGNVTSGAWNDAHLAPLIAIGYSANAAIPAWSYVQGAINVELVEAQNTITLTLPAATAFPGMNLRIINVGSGVITITDGGSFTYELTASGQSVLIYASSLTGAWTALIQSN